MSRDFSVICEIGAFDQEKRLLRSHDSKWLLQPIGPHHPLAFDINFTAFCQDKGLISILQVHREVCTAVNLASLTLTLHTRCQIDSVGIDVVDKSLSPTVPVAVSC